MQLKKIEIQGFKSFADKTEIVFLDGVTTIVGPNGSGKSNISDAIKWVLGEQSTKALRGSKMEDVIFAGTEARKKLGFAEVSMYLDNSDGSLPVDYSEVVVTRKIYRTGESVYSINDTECRLKDVQELFMDTGVGRDGYSIISQGKVDEILSSKSEERRHIFEEASGIVKYRVRKEEAERKLQNTTVSLNRVTDILHEIEGLIEPLAIKSETAKKYLDLRDKLKNIDVRIFINNISKSDEGLKKIDDEIKAISESVKNSEENTTKLQEQKADLKRRLEEVILQIEQTQEKYFKSESEFEKLNSEIEIANTNISNSNGNIIRLDTEIADDKEKIELLKQEIEAKLSKKASMLENRKKFEVELEDKNSELEILLKSLDDKGNEIENVKKNIENKNNQIYEIKIENSSLETKLETNNEQLETLQKSETKNISSVDSMKAQIDDMYMNLNSKKSSRDEVSKEYDGLNAKKEEAYNKLKEEEEKYNKLKEDVMTTSSKLTYLKNLELENEGYQKSVKESLDYAKKNNLNTVYGTLASLISVNEKIEYAIEIALGGYMQNVVCEREDEAKQIIEYLKANSLGRVTFLPLSSIKSYKTDFDYFIKKQDGVVGYAIELINYDDKYKNAINLALYNVLIVEDIDTAIRISKKSKNSLKIVTLSGELISQVGSITGGNNKIKSMGLIGRKEKIEALENLLKIKQEKADAIFSSNLEVKKVYDEASSKLDSLSSKMQEMSIEVAKAEASYQNLKKDLERLEENKNQALKKKDDIAKENEQINISISNNDKKIEEISKEIDTMQEQVNEYARFNREKQERIDYLSEDIMNLKISLSSFDESAESIDEMEAKIKQDIENFENAILKKEEQKVKFDEEILAKKEEIENINKKILEMSEFKQEFGKILDNLKASKEDITLKESKIDSDIVNGIKSTEKIREAMAKAESKKTKFELEKDNLKNKMWDDYELTVTSAEKIYATLPELEENVNINKEAEKIRNQINDLGEISISSIEEYKKTKERFDFISNQKVDLEETMTKLTNLIENMTTIMKQQFSKQFKLIRENFNETFKELFGGGKADLILLDEANILESGIEITVQPPGKKLQNMMLLSGGERALTATALLFAILKIKTPPFCILDEIEAALDDVNVHRFADYIKKYSKATQFVVITHRKGTMEVAKCTYGVTMQEYGISKVVSIKMK